MRHVSVCAVSALILGGIMTSSAAYADDVHKGRFSVDPSTAVNLPLGVTDIDFNFDGKPGHAVSTYTDIASAHNNTTYRFASPDWKTILFEPGDSGAVPQGTKFPQIHSEFATSQGADYRTQTVRLLRDAKAGTVQAVVAIRPFGHSWVDSLPVTMELFTLTKSGADRTDGTPPEYFKLTSWFVTEKCYPDADWAMQAELGLKLPQGEEQDASSKSQMAKACTR